MTLCSPDWPGMVTYVSINAFNCFRYPLFVNEVYWPFHATYNAENCRYRESKGLKLQGVIILVAVCAGYRGAISGFLLCGCVAAHAEEEKTEDMTTCSNNHTVGQFQHRRKNREME